MNIFTVSSLRDTETSDRRLEDLTSQLTRGGYFLSFFLSFFLSLICLSLITFSRFLASWVGGLIGIQLFHLQHQCNTPYRVTPAVHSKWDAGMLGSTHLLVPFPLTLVTAAIEFHHIHHASTQVPSYHLAACHREGEMHVKGKGTSPELGLNYLSIQFIQRVGQGRENTHSLGK